MSGPVTLLFRYCLVGAPCGGASLGIVGVGSGCWDVAREFVSLPLTLREGVPTLAGIGLGTFVAPGRIAGDWVLISFDNSPDDRIDLQQVDQG